MKTQFKDYTPRQNGLRSIEEAAAEIQREMDVRKRLFDRWVSEGKMSWMDAHDRMERHMSALKHLIAYSNRLDEEARAVNNPPANSVPMPLPVSATPLSKSPENGLDDMPESAAM